MSKKEGNTSRSVHRVDLSLPVVQTDSYEIFYTTSQPNFRSLTIRKPLIDTQKKTTDQTTARFRGSARLKHLIGPVNVNFLVDANVGTGEMSCRIAESTPNFSGNSTSSHKTLKPLRAVHRRTKPRPIKEDADCSRSSSTEKFLYDSFGSFDNANANKSRNNNMWQNMHHPQLSSTKAIHLRNSKKRTLAANETHFKASSTKSLDNLSQDSTTSNNEQLYEKIENLTKSYFPQIQQIRHSCKCPDLVTNRNSLYRESNRNFMPILSRTRAVR